MKWFLATLLLAMCLARNAAADGRGEGYFTLEDIEIVWARLKPSAYTTTEPSGAAGGTRASTRPRLAIGDRVVLRFRFRANFGNIDIQRAIDEQQGAERTRFLAFVQTVHPIDDGEGRGQTRYQPWIPSEPTIELPAGSDLRRLDAGIVTLPDGKILQNIEEGDLYLAPGTVFNTTSGYVEAVDPDFIDPETGQLVPDPGILYVCAVVLDSAGEITPTLQPDQASWEAWSRENCERRVVLDRAARVQDILATVRLRAQNPTRGPVRIGVRAAIFGHDIADRTLQRVLLESETSLVEIVDGAVSNLAIVNGSFEHPVLPEQGYYVVQQGSQEIDGWVVGSGTIDRVDTYWSAPRGRYSIDLFGSSVGSLYQDIPGLTVGQSYTVSFQLSGNPDCAPEIKTLIISAGDKSKTFEVSTAGWSIDSMRWIEQEFRFTAGEETERLTFQSTSSGQYCGPVIDDVRISEATRESE